MPWKVVPLAGEHNAFNDAHIITGWLTGVLGCAGVIAVAGVHMGTRGKHDQPAQEPAAP